MKKIICFSVVISFVMLTQLTAQSGFLKKVTKSVTKEVLGTPDKSDQQPEPMCASDQAVIAMDLGGKLQIDYRELFISILSDGRILAQHTGTKEYYVGKDGVTTGPYKEGDPEIADFVPAEGDGNEVESFIARNKPYISKSADKLLITFGGKSYGPYAQINDFAVTRSKEKFVAVVVETLAMTEDQGKKMEEAVKNARTDQERMEIAMKYGQQMQQNMMKGGGPNSIQPKLVSNDRNATYDPLKSVGASLSGDIKYDEIVLVAYDKILDMQGNTIRTLDRDDIGAKPLFLNSDNSRYAVYKSGTLSFSDNKTMSELFNPHMIKTEGKVWLAYLYYSPKRNAIMQHKIPF
jgi:hypothetical protein